MREIIDLDGLWRFLPDLDPDYHDSDAYARAEWDRRHWEWVRVPGCWNKYAERYAVYEGVAWFARSFHLGNWSRCRVGVLRFGAANYEARVYVNGELAGEHQGGYTEFCLDVSHLLRSGENWVVVRVDSRRHRVLLPACFGWFNYGGLHRGVALEISHGARLEWLGVQALPAGAGAECHVRAEILLQKGQEPEMHLAIRDPEGEVVWQDRFDLHPDQRAAGWDVMLDEAKAWTLSAPALYTLCATLVSVDGITLDQVTVEFGIRHVCVDGSTILLNGEPIWLKGICYMPDHPATGLTHDPSIASRDLDQLVGLGINALRFHIPPHPAFLAQCDRRGILIWSEAPIYCLAPQEKQGSAFSRPAYRQLANDMLREMVRAAYNHPSVVLWGIGNECSVAHPEAMPFFTELAETVRSLDDSRLLAYASLYGEMGPVGDLLDVIGVNEYWGWYDRISSIPGQDKSLLRGVREGVDGSRTVEVNALELDRLRQELASKAERYGKPMLLTEFGADAVPGYRSDDLHLWSEEYQALFLRRTFEAMAESRHVCGAFPFLYQDYPDPSKYIDAHWDGMNYKGIASYDRQPKLAMEALRDIYRKEKGLDEERQT